MAIRIFAIVWVIWGFFLKAERACGSDDFPVSSDYSLSEQNNPSITVNLDGSFAVTWADYRNGHSDIYGQLFDSVGIELGDNFVLNDDTSGAWQFEPQVASDWHGSYYVVWKDYRNNAYPFDPDVYFQRFAGTGLIGPNINVTTEPPDSSHQSPAIDVTGWGRVVACWTDLRYRNWDVFVELLDSSGNVVSPSRRVNDDVGATPQHEPDAAVAPVGWFIVVWYDGRNGNDDIYMQKFDSAGEPVGPNIKVNDDIGTTKQKFPSVAVGGNGMVYIAWTDWRNGDYPNDPDIYFQPFDSTLSRIGLNRRINHDGTETSQRHPRIGVDLTGNACIVWSDSSSGDWNVAGQMIECTGQLRGSNFPVNTEHSGRQLLADVALDGYRAYFAWADSRTGNFDIYGRILQYNEPALITQPSRIELTRGRDDPDEDTIIVTVTNAGYGDVNYGVYSDRDWIGLSKSAGTTPDSFAVIVRLNTLGYGMHQGVVRVIDYDRNDSSKYIPVIVSVTTAMIATDPDSVQAALYRHESAFDSVLVSVSGSSAPDWSAHSAAGWLTLISSTGTSGDYLSFQSSGADMIPGVYADSIVVEDTSAGNSPFGVPCVLQVLVTDTAGALPVQAEPGVGFQQSVYLKAHNQIISGEFLLQYDTAMISVDSFVVSASADSVMNFLFERRIDQPLIWLRIEADSDLTAIPPVEYYLGDLWGAVADSLTGTTRISAIEDGIFLGLESLGIHVPVWVAGDIEISPVTDADVGGTDGRQPIFALEQNRPNPFNGRTTISFSLAQTGPVSLRVYNILGQQVCTLIEADLDAGVHTVVWGGRDAAGREMASGIFFYKLMASTYSAVRKMVFLK